MNFDGFVKSPSAALRFNPAPLDIEFCFSGKWEKHFQSLTGKRSCAISTGFKRCGALVRAPHSSALHGRGTLRVPDIGREASRPYN
jgi:hypothetical protein